jgi:uncharacterized protein (DUF58 family)
MSAATAGHTLMRLMRDLRLRLPWRAGARAAEHRLDRRTVFIVPTRAGLLFAAVIATMLITAINYGLALGYGLTFLLTGVWLISMVHTWRNLAGLVMRAGRSEPVHAGEFAEFGLVLRNPQGPERFALELQVPGTRAPARLDIPVGPEHLLTLALPTERRGWHETPRLRLQSNWPLGLWRAWAHWLPQTRILVLPQPEPPGVPLPVAQAEGREPQGRMRGEDDPSGLRPWRLGDSPRRLAWKAIARMGSDALLVTEFEGGQGGLLWLDWAQLPITLDTEARVSRLTRWVLEAESLGLRYGLRLPHAEVSPGSGAAHRARCLRELALQPA